MIMVFMKAQNTDHMRGENMIKNINTRVLCENEHCGRNKGGVCLESSIAVYKKDNGELIIKCKKQ
jgi:hypothetical protein